MGRWELPIEPPPYCPPLHPEIPAGAPIEETAPVGKPLWTEEPSYPMQTLLFPHHTPWQVHVLLRSYLNVSMQL